MLKILEDACCSGSWDGQNLQIFGLTKLGQPWAWAWPCLVTMAVLFDIENVQSHGGFVLHVGEAKQYLKSGIQVQLHLDKERRYTTMQNHTATHILNFVMREIIPGSEQRGSLVTSDRLRFDFNTNNSLSKAELALLTKKCNELIDQDHKVSQSWIPLEEAQAIPGIRAMFREAYHDPALVVSIGHNLNGINKSSIEFCGGIHVKYTSDVGKLVIVSQKLASGGIRRLTAVTGKVAEVAIKSAISLKNETSNYSNQITDVVQSNLCDYHHLMSLQKDLLEFFDNVISTPLDIIHKDDLKEEIVAIREKLQKHIRKVMKQTKNKIVSDLEAELSRDNISSIVKILPDGLEPKDLKNISKQFLSKHEDTSLMLLSRKGKRVFGVCFVSKKMRENGLGAQSWAKEASSFFGGHHKGNDISATVVGYTVSNIEEGVRQLKQIAESNTSMSTRST